MPEVILYYTHPGQRYSRANAEMWRRARALEGITRVDLYAEYPRFDIDIDREQQRLLDHQVIVFQFPMFWYSTPALLKEWQDLVLEHGFAYGKHGTRLAGKHMWLALTAAGPADAYRPEGYQHHPMRTFLTPLERTARLCKMTFLPPYILYGSLRAHEEGRISPHAEGYVQLLEALRDGRFDVHEAARDELLTCEALPDWAEPVDG